jgi:hypothetical protein
METTLENQFRELPPGQQVAAALVAIGRLYQDGQTVEARELASKLTHGAQLITAWCLYREKNYTEAHAVLSQLPESPKALELWAYLYAYNASGFRNEQKLLETVDKLPRDNFNRTNALVIAAREKGADLKPWIASFDRALATVEQANLLQNAARLALEKENLPTALEIINYAIEAYGIRTNWHHRGAANYWKSVILEKMEDTYAAWQAGQESLRCWQTQHDLEPGHPNWPKRLQEAQKRADELQAKLAI